MYAEDNKLFKRVISLCFSQLFFSRAKVLKHIRFRSRNLPLLFRGGPSGDLPQM